MVGARARPFDMKRFNVANNTENVTTRRPVNQEVR